MSFEVHNLHGRTPRQLTRRDTLYGMRKLSGFQHFFFGKFVGLNRGSISIKGVWVEPEHRARQSDNIECVETFRVDKCLLWGKGKDDGWPRCHWFSRGKDYPAS